MQGGPSNKRGAFFVNEMDTLNASNVYQHEGILDVDFDNGACFTSDIVDDDSEFIVPVYVNGVRCKALRDSRSLLTKVLWQKSTLITAKQ